MAENPIPDGPMQWHSDYIPYLDSLQGREDAFFFTRDDDQNRQKTWFEPKNLMTDECILARECSSHKKKMLQRAVRMYCIKDMREFKVDDSNKSIWRLVCKRKTQGCRWLLRGIVKPDGLWEITKFHPKHTCDMGQSRADHFNLDINMIAHVLLKHIEETPRMPIKTCISMVHSKYGKIISKRKGFLGHRHAFEMIFGTWESSFRALPGWDDVYGRYDIKLLIVVDMDANGSIFPLAFVITANESNETWGMFLTHLKTHVIKGRQGICVLSDSHKGILHNMRTLEGWQPPHVYHRYCLRHLKANLQKKFGNDT
ncbi:uncharacterized protein LOC132045868 [Lycium ferocissimum]|uniref:uncharacterized protein LOC132045868 n=1 Tax=Lycium ferocissimum TaxID=112874 RepID=UPI002814F659|nr:uncharacterized protein LOC132045868 [Lycium ferocissimum]